MGELKKIITDVKAAYSSLNDPDQNLSTILSNRRINSRNAGAIKFMTDMTVSVKTEEKPLAVGLLAGLIGKKKLLDDAKIKK